MNIQKIKVIFFFSDKVKANDILWGLIGLGINVKGSNTIVTMNNATEQQVVELVNEVKDYDYVISQNFCVSLAAACHVAKVKYVSWIYDSPQVALYTDFALFEENYIFCFDKVQTDRLKMLGIPHIFHQPLAVNSAFLSTIDFANPQKKIPPCEVSFIGQMYNSVLTAKLFKKMSISERLNFENENDPFICNWQPHNTLFNCNFPINGSLSKYINVDEYPIKNFDFDYWSKCLFNTPYLANKERLLLLSESAKHFDTVLHTKESDMISAKAINNLTVLGPAYEDLPYRIYKASKLNLNITLRSIESGVPQRVFDIMGAGGAVISNYQDELVSLFKPEKEIILFTSVDEFIEKSSFYLAHPTLLKNLAIAGHNRVMKEYTYEQIIPQMLDKTL